MITITQENFKTYINKNGGDLPPGITKIKLMENLDFSCFDSSDFYIRLPKHCVFDANDHIINLGKNYTAGIFESSATTIMESPTIKNMGIINGNLYPHGGYFIKSNTNYFKIINCYSTGEISDNGGGIVGSYATGKVLHGYAYIENCYSTGSIGKYAGGIVGSHAGCDWYQNLCHIKDCYSLGNSYSRGLIKNEANYAGGIVGAFAGESNGQCKIENSYSLGNIGVYSGGIVGAYAGNNHGVCIIENCMSRGDIDNCGGGITGFATGSSRGRCRITNSYSSGDIGFAAGGISGYCSGYMYYSNVDINKCYSVGEIGIWAGGISGACSGFRQGTLNINNCYTSGTILKGGGGICGSMSGYQYGKCRIRNCYCGGNKFETDSPKETLTGNNSENCSIKRCGSNNDLLEENDILEIIGKENYCSTNDGIILKDTSDTFDLEHVE